MRELEDFQSRILSAFNTTSSRRGNGQESLAAAEWMPLVDIAEDDKEYLITAELPEVKKEDVKVTMENGVLTVTGERKFEKEEKNKKYHRVERSYGSFARSFALPDERRCGEGERGVQGRRSSRSVWPRAKRPVRNKSK